MDEVHGNLSHAMRDNYNQHGVDEYYRKVATTYRNPFFPGVKRVIWTFMNRWWEAEGREMFATVRTGPKSLRVLDMAAGSGEATLCLLEWAERAQGLVVTDPPTFQSSSASTSTLPPSPSQASSQTPSNHPLAHLHSAAGVGPSFSARPAFIPLKRATRPSPAAPLFTSEPPRIPPRTFQLDIVATDPYTSPAYLARTSRPCHPLSFTDLASGLLPSLPPPLPPLRPRSPSLPPPSSLSPTPAPSEARNDPLWHLIICSFALHLVPTPSELFALLYTLSGKARWLVVVAPHKKPEIKEGWGWVRWDIARWREAEGWYAGQGAGTGRDDDDEAESEMEIVRDKVRLRLYRSVEF